MSAQCRLLYEREFEIADWHLEHAACFRSSVNSEWNDTRLDTVPLFHARLRTLRRHLAIRSLRHETRDNASASTAVKVQEEHMHTERTLTFTASGGPQSTYVRDRRSMLAIDASSGEIFVNLRFQSIVDGAMTLCFWMTRPESEARRAVLVQTLCVDSLLHQ